MSTLTVEGISVAFGAARALDDVSLTVAAGAVTAVLGANGAGKTTLLRTINGLVRPVAGTVRYDGRDLGSMQPEDVVRLGIAHVPEGRGVITELTVRENLRLGGLWRRDRAGARRAEREAFELFPALAPHRGQVAQALSGGERQMLALARALVAAPRLLLLDEPSLGLAPKVVASLMAVIKDLTVQRGMTVLLVEQNARSALSIAEHAVVLNVGRVAAQAPARELAQDDALRHTYLGF